MGRDHLGNKLFGILDFFLADTKYRRLLNDGGNSMDCQYYF